MTNRIHLGDGCTLPLDIVTMRSLVLGVSGSGKSTFGRSLAERIHGAGQRFCVIDLKNDWWGLKASADGKSPAIPVVIIGGPRADIPLDEDAGEAVADIVAETDHSFIIDLDELSKGKGIRFLGSFFERLYHVNREPLLLICDEADRYAPQKPMSPEAHVTLGAADDIARRGRKRGIGSLWLSQRPAVIAKNVTSQCELVVTFRTTSSLDLKELKDHIGRVANADQVAATMKTVAALKNGQAILMSQHPDTAMFKTCQLPMPDTFDSSATPKVGQRRIEPKELAAPDLAALGERIKSTVEKAKAEDPKELRKRIRELEQELATHPTADEIDEGQAQRVEDLEERLSRARSEIRSLRENVIHDILAAAKAVQDVAGRLVEEMPDPTPEPREPSSEWVRREMTKVAPPRPTPRAASSSPSLGKGERVILTAIAQHREGVTREQLTVLTGYKRSSRDTYLQKLGAGGLVELDERILVTKAGLAALGSDFRPLPTGDALRKHWLDRLGGGERVLLEAVITKHPHGCTRDWLSEVTEYKRSSRDTYLQKLMARRLIESKTGGVVRASDALFGGGR